MPPDVAKFVIVMGTLIGLPMATMLLYPLVRAVARRIEYGPGGAALPDEVKAELEDLRSRVAELEAAHDQMVGPSTPLPDKVAALEERVDFTERVLAQKRLTGDR